MEMREIEAFLAVAEELHFGRAAARLGLTTSRVSQTVRTFERRVGTRLFERSSRRVELTTLGAHLLDGVRPAYQDLLHAVREASILAQPRPEPFRLGFGNSLPEYVVETLSSSFRAAYRDWAIVPHRNPAADVRGWLQPDRDDVFVTWIPGAAGSVTISGLRIGPTIQHEQRGILLRRDHPLAGCTTLHIDQVADYDVLQIFPDLGREYADQWTPAITPSGRSIHRVPRLHSTYLEEVANTVFRENLLHLTVVELDTWAATFNSHLTVIPLHGLPPMRIAPISLEAIRSPRVIAFEQLATRVGISSGWISDS